MTSHDAFQYFGRDYGLTFLAPQGLSTESEASAQGCRPPDPSRCETEKHFAPSSSRTSPIHAFWSSIAEGDREPAIGGTLYPGALSQPDGPAPSYLEMMRHNATTLAQALTS